MIEDKLKRSFRIAFVVILLLGLALRLYGITWGLPNELHPYYYHPDEARLIQYMANMHPGSFDFYPDDFAYPTFHVLFVGAILLVLSKLGFIIVAADPLFYAANPGAFAHIILVGRLIGVGFSIASLVMVYLIGKHLYNRKAGIIAMLFMAINPLDVVESHYFTLDAPMIFWMLLCVFASIRIAKEGERVWYLLAGAALGLAGATKYPGLMAGVFIVAGHIFFTRKHKDDFKDLVRSFLSKDILICGIIFIAAFLIGVPYAMLEPGTFIGNFIKTYEISSGADQSFPWFYNIGLASWSYHWNNIPFVYQLTALLPFAFGIMMYLSVLVSFWLMIRYADLRSKVFVMGAFALYLLLIGKWINVFPRYVLFLMPLGALACAIGQRITLKVWRGPAPMVIFWLVIVATFVHTVSLDYKFNDTQDQAYDWIMGNIADDSKIATTLWAPLRYSPLQDREALDNKAMRNDVIVSKRANDPDSQDMTFLALCKGGLCKSFKSYTMYNPAPDWFDKRSPDYVILSSLETDGVDAPHFDKSVDSIRSFYTRFANCNSSYYTVAVFDRPYFLESFYALLDPRLKSLYPSPRIEILRKAQ